MIALVWPFLQAFWKPLVIVLAVVGLYGYAYHRGDAHRDAIWKAHVRAEQIAQEKVIDDTKDKALAEIVRLNGELEKSNVLLDTLQKEAATDPNAGRVSMGSDSLRRLNRIGARRSH